MNRFIVLVALLTTVMAGAAHAAGLPMMKGLPVESAASQLADRIEESLKKDPTGNAIISGSVCTTPEHFFEAIHVSHPSAKLSSPAELPAYLRGLVRKHVNAADDYRMARILQDKSGKCRLDAKGWTRAFATDEYGWFDPNTGEAILAGDCGNVVAERVRKEPPPPAKKGPCVTVSFSSGIGQRIHVLVVGMKPLPADACGGISQDDGPFAALIGILCDDNCLPSMPYVKSIFGDMAARIYGRLIYKSFGHRQTLRFGTYIWDDLLGICKQNPPTGNHPNTETCMRFIAPHAHGRANVIEWKNRYHIEIPDDWRLDTGDCPERHEM